MKIKDLYETYTEWYARLNELIESSRLLKSKSWQKWEEPFLNWTQEYMENSLDESVSYPDIFKNCLSKKLAEQISYDLKEWHNEAVKTKLIDNELQFTPKSADELTPEELVKSTEWFLKIATSLSYEVKRNTTITSNALSILYYILLSKLFLNLIQGNNPHLVTLEKTANKIIKYPSTYKIYTESIHNLIYEAEEKSETYFGSYPSDNSDSEEENESIAHPENLRFRKIHAEDLINQLAIYQPVNKEKTLYAIKKEPASPAGRWKANITNLTQEKFSDLICLNDRIKSGIPISNAIKDIKTPFFVAKYRGIAYNTKDWSKPSRAIHRRLDETKQALFSASAYSAADIKSIDDYYKLPTEQREILQKKVEEKALEIRTNLLKARNSEPVIDLSQNYIFKNQALQIQSDYTSNYDKFHQALKNNAYGNTLLNASNPFISTGNVPLHALEYAYATKYYQNAKDNRLRPRWRKNGLAERPYSGKVYVTLHPITDFGDNGPFDVVKLQKEGELSPSIINNILNEREATFPGLIEKDRLQIQHIAKYPSFKKEYKEIYLYKYGLNESWYLQFKDALLKHPPHSSKHKHYKNLLSNWLCHYHEVRLINEARKKAHEQGGVVVYYNQNGLFELEPDNPNIIGTSSSPANAASRNKINDMKLFRHNITDLISKEKIQSNSEAIRTAAIKLIDSKKWPQSHSIFLNDLFPPAVKNEPIDENTLAEALNIKLDLNDAPENNINSKTQAK